MMKCGETDSKTGQKNGQITIAVTQYHLLLCSAMWQGERSRVAKNTLLQHGSKSQPFLCILCILRERIKSVTDSAASDPQADVPTVHECIVINTGMILENLTKE